MISIILPYIDLHDILDVCIKHIAENTVGPYEIILVNNGSDVPYPAQNVKHIHFEKNQGVPLALKAGLEIALGDIIVFPHSDVLIHEYGWNKKVEKAFKEDGRLGMAGFFGAMGLGDNGGRAECYSNLQGRIWGAGWSDGQSQFTDGVVPASTLDGLTLLFRTDTLKKLNHQYNFLSDTYPQHHFYDRIWPCIFIEEGYHVATIGVACDHRGGTTANTSDKYRESTLKWLERNNISLVDNNPDLTTYYEAEKRFFKMFQHRLPLWVDYEYNYRWAR